MTDSERYVHSGGARLWTCSSGAGTPFLMFINGSEDIRPSWPTRQLAALMPHGRYVEIAGAAHTVWLTHADELCAALREAVASGRSARYVCLQWRPGQLLGAASHVRLRYVEGSFRRRDPRTCPFVPLVRVELKYGCNPHQGNAAFESGESPPVAVRNGAPSMINMLDALNGWQLVAELGGVLDLPAAASFKHVSPAGVAVGMPLAEDLRRACEVGDRELTPLAAAYVRARGADPKCSFGDFVALSAPVDMATAAYLRGVVSDGVVAPGFEPGAFETLAAKKGGSFVVLEIDPGYRPPPIESREVFGVTLVQHRNDRRVTFDDLDGIVCGEFGDAAKRDLVVGLVTLKYTQSNSVCYVAGGQTIGIGAGQQSRVDCTKLAGAKADVWHLGRSPMVFDLAFRQGVRRQDRINWRVRYIEGDLTADEEAAFAASLEQPASALDAEAWNAWLAGLTDVALVSDGFIPFRDNIDHAAKHGVRYIAQPGGSARDGDVEAACREYGIAMVHTGVRLFHH